MDEGENAHKRETNHCVYWNPGRFVRKSEPWQIIHPRGAHSLGQLGTACFISTSFFYTSLNSARLESGGKHFQSQKSIFQLLRTVRIICQKSAWLTCWQSCFMVFLRAKRLWYQILTFNILCFLGFSLSMTQIL